MKVLGDRSLDGIETFLDEARIPVRLAFTTPGGHPWMVSLWFRYRDGCIECATSKRADVVSSLERNGRVAFEVSTNDPPYEGVRGRGSATVTDSPNKALLRDLLERYLGSADTPLGRRLLSDGRDEVTIAVEPAVVFGWDYSDRMRDTAG